ncbi:MAG: hypothetical protein KKH94_01380 [Candidatus Omnitrophica bacterium]|nr:hypothetical protein [Candidatus Omnitrophota bacterium]
MTKIYQETIIIIGIVVFLCFLIIKFGCIPSSRDIKVLKNELIQNKERNVRIQELTHRKDFFADMVKKVELYHNEVKELLPKQIKLSELFRELSVMAQDNQVALLSTKPIDEVGSNIISYSGQTGTKNQFKKSNIEIVLESNYDGLGKFIEALENNTLTIMTVKNLNIALDEKTKDPLRLKSVLTIEAYYQAG